MLDTRLVTFVGLLFHKQELGALDTGLVAFVVLFMSRNFVC